MLATARVSWLVALLVLVPTFPPAEPPLPQDPPAVYGVRIDPLPKPARQLIVVPPPAAPARTFSDVIGDVLREQ